MLFRSAKERAKIAPDAQVELVVYPPKRSFLEVLSEQWGGSASETAVSTWLTAHLTVSERQALRALRGPLAPFRPGEMLTLMPYVLTR